MVYTIVGTQKKYGKKKSFLRTGGVGRTGFSTKREAQYVARRLRKMKDVTSAKVIKL